jgi:hypothetical protein
VVGLAYWAYQENIKTQNALTQTEELQRDIGAARARLSVLRAEWAYLNRPDRLTDLVNLNYNRLHLTPLQAENFGAIDTIKFPYDNAFPLGELSDLVEIANRESDQ